MNSNHTQTQIETRNEQVNQDGVLNLRGQAGEQRVRWDNDVVDNEGLDKKKSKGLFDYLLFYYY